MSLPPPQAPVQADDAPADSPVPQSRNAYMTLLFNRYRDSLYRYLARFVPRDEIPDLVQETYFRLLRHDSVVQIDALARGLLFQTATNLARDHRRRNKARHSESHVPLEESEEVGAPGTPDERLASEQMLEIIEHTLEQLPKDTRTVFVLSRFRGLNYTDIGAAMSLSSRTVARKMAEALDALSSATGGLQ